MENGQVSIEQLRSTGLNPYVEKESVWGFPTYFPSLSVVVADTILKNCQKQR